MYTKLNASRSYVYAVARACDQNQISRRVSAIVRYVLFSDGLIHSLLRIVQDLSCIRQIGLSK